MHEGHTTCIQRLFQSLINRYGHTATAAQWTITFSFAETTFEHCLANSNELITRLLQTSVFFWAHNSRLDTFKEPNNGRRTNKSNVNCRICRICWPPSCGFMCAIYIKQPPAVWRFFCCACAFLNARVNSYGAVFKMCPCRSWYLYTMYNPLSCASSTCSYACQHAARCSLLWLFIMLRGDLCDTVTLWVIPRGPLACLSASWHWHLAQVWGAYFLHWYI